MVHPLEPFLGVMSMMWVAVFIFVGAVWCGVLLLAFCFEGLFEYRVGYYISVVFAFYYS